MDIQVVTRFAPSPTGFMHVGGVRTALFAWLWARKNNGTFILRIEDTDQERIVPGSLKHIQESLSWLGIDWQYGPNMPTPFGSCIQSERLDTYRTTAQKLVEKGLAYPDPYSAEEVDAFRRSAQADKRAFLFREHRPTEMHAWDGTRPLRFRVPEIKRYKWHDEVRGDLEAGEEALDDFILIKSDGYPTYNLAHIVDDFYMGVTHVFRADEFISSTPRFLSLYEALEIIPPAFVTLPPILREDRTKKLGKRDGAKDILDYATEGYLPDAMVNFLALTGWNPGTEQEIFSPSELLATFDIARIQSHGAVLNAEKLRWLNREHLALLDDTAFANYALPILTRELKERGVAPDSKAMNAVLSIIRDRISTYEDITTMTQSGDLDFFFQAPALDATLIPGKDSNTTKATEHLQILRAIVNGVGDFDFTSAHLKEIIWPYASENGRGEVLWPLRYALTGRNKSPDPFEVAGAIGKLQTIARIDAALMILNANKT